MERLTHRRESDKAACLNGMTAQNAPEVVQKAAELLCCYEDTGLEPEEVRSLAVAEAKRKSRLADMQAGKTLDGVPVGLVLPKLDVEGEDAQTSADARAGMAEIKDVSLQHLIDLAQAEKDERLVVLPCKVGESVHGEKWMGEVAEIAINSDGISLYVRSGGGGFYCSPEDLSINAREKAEEALRKEAENG